MSIYDNTKLLPLRTYRQMRAQRDRSPELGPHGAAIRFTRKLKTGYWALRSDVLLYEAPGGSRPSPAERIIEIAFLDFENETKEPIVSQGTMKEGIWTPEGRLRLPPRFPPVHELFVLPRSEDGQPWLTIEAPADRARQVTEALQQIVGTPPPPFHDITSP